MWNNASQPLMLWMCNLIWRSETCVGRIQQPAFQSCPNQPAISCFLVQVGLELWQTVPHPIACSMRQTKRMQSVGEVRAVNMANALMPTALKRFEMLMPRNDNAFAVGPHWAWATVNLMRVPAKILLLSWKQKFLGQMRLGDMWRCGNL